MTPLHWLEFGAMLHLLLATVAIWFAFRVDGYTD